MPGGPEVRRQADRLARVLVGRPWRVCGSGWTGSRPERRAKDLSPEQRVALAEATLAVTRQSYATAGITNDLARASALKASGEPRGRYRHHVFARGGRACWACGAVIERVELAGRRMYVCGGCQR
jgi:endonuclease-8